MATIPLSSNLQSTTRAERVNSAIPSPTVADLVATMRQLLLRLESFRTDDSRISWRTVCDSARSRTAIIDAKPTAHTLDVVAAGSYDVEKHATSPLTEEDRRPRLSSTEYIRVLEVVGRGLLNGDKRRNNIDQLRDDAIERERGFHASARVIKTLF